MTAVTPVQFGQSGTDPTSLFLKVYTGSFVSAPRSGIFLMGGVADNFIFRANTGGGGKSWQFLMGADVPDPDEFTPGDDLLGQVWAVEEGQIVSDGYIVCHKWLGKDRFDEAQFAGNILPYLAKMHRSKIERLYDKRAMITAALGARQTTAVTKNGLNVHNGGTRVTRSAGGTGILSDAYPRNATGAANLIEDIRSFRLSCDNKNIDGTPGAVGLLMDPYLRTVLSYDTSGKLWSRDYVTGNDQQRHEIEVIERCAVLGYPNPTSQNGPLPNENITGTPSKYTGNFTSGTSDGIPGVLAFCRSMEGEFGLGSVTFESLEHYVHYYPEKKAWLVMTTLRSGCDIMHPWCLGSIEAID